MRLFTRVPCRLLVTLVAVMTLFTIAPFVDAGDGKIDPAILAKVKQATVYLQVKLSSGRIVQGSGFFADAPGVIITNAHVLGMLAADGRRPQQTNVVVSGVAGSKTLPATILGVDRNSDLAVLRVEGKDLPAPLPFGASKDLIETQSIFIFGFPFGATLGKNITVSSSSISSLPKQANVIKKIQVNGGMHPGNSGGPVTDAKGQVIGVAVSGLANTQIHFAIPTDQVHNFLNGRSSINLGTEHRYKDGDQVKLPVRVELSDPLGRISKTAVEVWVGNTGPTRPGTGTKEPKAAPGDSAKQTTQLLYDAKAGIGLGDVVLPALENPKQVYWVRAVVTDGKGETRYYTAFARSQTAAVERKPVTLKYQPKLGGLMAVDLVCNSTMKLRGKDGDFSLKSNVSAGLRERAAKERDKESLRMQLTFASLSAGIFIDEQLLKGNEDSKKMFNDLGFVTLNLEMDTEGSQTAGGADLDRVPKTSQRFLAGLSEQVLQGLDFMNVAIPSGTLVPLQTWKGQREVEMGPLGRGVPARADIKYTYVGMRERDGKPEAVIHLEGTLRGRKGDDLNVAGSLSGNLHLSPTTGQVVDGSVNVKLDADLEFQKQTVKANGTFAVSLKRNPPAPPKKK